MREPPLGIMPRHIWVEKRLNDIESAIKRYIEAEMPIPFDWVKEYIELVLSKSAC